MILCRTGFFVGIDYRRVAGTSDAEVDASASAAKLGALLVLACPQGAWRYAEDKDALWTRTQLCRVVHAWAESGAESHWSLMYLGGHAENIDGGLVVRPFDYDAKVPFDSSLPVQRILDIVAAKGEPNAKYLIFLDCCRVGEKTIDVLRAPANVTIVYSTGPSGGAAQVGRRSRFVEALCLGGRRCATTVCDGVTAYHLSELIERTRTELYAGIVGEAQALEVFGADISKLYVPAIGLPTGYQDLAVNHPVCMLESRPCDAGMCVEHVSLVSACVCAWFGVPRTQASESRVVQVDESFMRLSVRLPSDVALCPAGGLLEYLLSRCSFMFNRLVMHWNGTIPERRLIMLSNGRHWDMTRLTSNSMLFKWQVRGKTCKAVASWDSSSTDLTITAASADEVELPLEYLLPEIRDIYEAFSRLGHVDCGSNV